TILSEPFCLVCPATHRLARKRQVAWSDLAGQPLVLLDHASGSRRLIDAALQAHDAEAAVVQEVGHTTTIFCMLQAGLGLSVVPELAVPQAWRIPASGDAPDALASRPLLPRVQRDIMLVRRRQRELSPVAQSVWDLIRGEAGQL
ncbi:LysR substrate-binding domain-containing protein, partial [Delftia tsuruhatensis]|uniref:LysR substrate-binding domain-containing protein n=2 Tax=Comamonadaceae TaxID=80864 RepID=UPI0039BD2A25